MRFIPLNRIKPGMVLARAVFDDSGRILISKGCSVTLEQLNKLVQRGYAGMYVEDAISDDIQIKETITVELRNKGVDCLREGNIDGCLNVAREIVTQIISSGSISLDMVDLRTFDDYTYRHSVNVGVLATIIGMGLNIKQDDLDDLCLGALLHDIGKSCIPDEILNKPARLTPEEFEIMKKHSQYSFDMLKDRIDISAKTKTAVLYHHENQDSTGYPMGLSGKDIPLFARIIHVADVYDALTSSRPYKKPYSSSEAIEYLMGGCGILFNKQIVEAFIKYIPVFPKGMNVILSDGREAIILENNSTQLLRPKVRLLTGETLDLALDPELRNITVMQLGAEEPDFTEELSRHLERAGVQRRKKILMIGAIDTNMELVSRMLASHYEFIWDMSGEHAFEQMKEGIVPELIIMDIDMPGLNGLQLIERIQREINNDIALIFLTSVANQEIIRKFRHLHAREYLVKPCVPIYLQERIQVILEGANH